MSLGIMNNKARKMSLRTQKCQRKRHFALLYELKHLSKCRWISQDMFRKEPGGGD